MNQSIENRISSPEAKGFNLMLNTARVSVFSASLSLIGIVAALLGIGSVENFLYYLVLVLYLVSYLLILLIFYPVWLYFYHKRLKEYDDNYPATPKQAIARYFVPFYNIWGFHKIHEDLAGYFRAYPARVSESEIKKFATAASWFYVALIAWGVIDLGDIDALSQLVLDLIDVGLAIALLLLLIVTTNKMESLYKQVSEGGPAVSDYKADQSPKVASDTSPSFPLWVAVIVIVWVVAVPILAFGLTGILAQLINYSNIPILAVVFLLYGITFPFIYRLMQNKRQDVGNDK